LSQVQYFRTETASTVVWRFTQSYQLEWIAIKHRSYLRQAMGGGQYYVFIMSRCTPVPTPAEASCDHTLSSYSLQVALLSQRGRAMLVSVLLASTVQYPESILLLLVIAASDLPLRTIKLFYCLQCNVEASCHKHFVESSYTPVNNKRRPFSEMSVINLPRFGAALCSTLGGRPLTTRDEATIGLESHFRLLHRHFKAVGILP